MTNRMDFPSGTTLPTQNESLMLFVLFQNMETKPVINWEGVAKTAGLKNAETAKVRWNQIKRKLKLWDKDTIRTTTTPAAAHMAASLSSPSSSSSPPALIKRRPGSRKPGPKPRVKTEVDELEGFDILELPQKPARRKPGPKPKPRIPEVLSGYRIPEDDDDDGGGGAGNARDYDGHEGEDARVKKELREDMQHEKERAEKVAVARGPVARKARTGIQAGTRTGTRTGTQAFNFNTVRDVNKVDAQTFNFNTVPGKDKPAARNSTTHQAPAFNLKQDAIMQEVQADNVSQKKNGMTMTMTTTGRSRTEPVQLDVDHHHHDYASGRTNVSNDPFFGTMQSDDADPHLGASASADGAGTELWELQQLLQAQSQPQSHQPDQVPFFTQSIGFNAEDLFGMDFED